MSRALASFFVLLVAGAFVPAAEGDDPVRPREPLEESVTVERRILALRTDPRRLAGPGECDRLAPGDLDVRIGRRRARVTSVERMPPPAVFWLLLDTSASLDAVHEVVKRDVLRVLREVVEIEEAEVALATVDEDLRLLVSATTDYERVAEAIAGVARGGQSFLRDGLIEILGQIAGDPREHVIVFWTDGADTLSIGQPEEVEQAFAATPNARLVLVAFPLAGGGGRPRMPDSLFTDLAERSGGELLQTGGDWLERLTSGLRRRWLVSVAPPTHATRDDALRATVEKKRCKARVLDVAPEAGRLPEVPESLVESWRRQHHGTDLAPCVPRTDDDRPWRRAPAADGTTISGCALDVVGEAGIRYRARSWLRSEIRSPLRLASRPWAVDADPPDALPRSPEEALDRLADRLPQPSGSGEDDASWDSRIVHGHTLFMLQGPLARALWETKPAYRAFARERLEAEASRGLELAAARIRLEMPSLDRRAAAEAARASVEGRRLLGAVTAPADADLRRILAAWLGDISARELFERWELRLAQELVDGRSDLAAAERSWRSMRARFALPEKVRTVAPLVLGRQGADGPIGFWRVQLPRAYWILARRTDEPDDFPYDHVPERPMALLALARALAEDRDIGVRAARGGLRVREVVYEPRVKAWKENPAHPFSRGVVRVALAPEGGPPEASFVVEASFGAGEGDRPEIDSLSVGRDGVSALAPPGSR